MERFGDPRVAVGAWLAAWRGWSSNPLAEAYARAELQRQLAKAWPARSPGLFALGVLLAFGVTAVNLGLLIDTLRFSGPGTRPFIAANASLGLGATLHAGLLFSACWLTARSYTAFSFALGFLERGPRARFRYSLDDMLATTALSEQELLVGALRFGLSRVQAPLAAACLCLASISALLLGKGDADPWLASALGLQLWASGVLAFCALLLAGVALGLCEHAGPWPSIGAAGLVALQPVAAAGVFWLQSEINMVNVEASLQSSFIWSSAAAIFILLAGLQLYLARRIEAWRRALAGAFGLALLLPYAVLASSAALGMGYDTPETMTAWLLQPLELLTILNPALLAHYLQPADQPGAGYSAAFGTAHWLRLCPFQLALVAGCAEFARDSIRRRKWGRTD